MRRVARSEALKLSESKRFVVLNENALANQPTALSTQWAIKSPFAQLATGAQSFQVVGNEIQRPLLKLKFYFQIDWGLLRFDRAQLRYRRSTYTSSPPTTKTLLRFSL